MLTTIGFGAMNRYQVSYNLLWICRTMQVEQNMCEKTILSKNSDNYLASKKIPHDYFKKGACSFPSTTLFPSILTFLGKGTNMFLILSCLPIYTNLFKKFLNSTILTKWTCEFGNLLQQLVCRLSLHYSHGRLF
jgi:hypothetical protein